jgi:phosphatidylinositol glycan class M
MYLLLIRHFYAACACFGLAVHLKIYPVIYAAPFLVLLDENYGLPIDWPNMLWTYERMRVQVLRLYLDDDEKVDDVLTEEDNDRLDNLVDKSSRALSRALRHGLMFLSPTRLMFGVVSAAVFFAFGGLMYSM